MILLDGNSLTLEKAWAIAQGISIGISPQTKSRVSLCRNYIETLLTEGKPIYGVNTGFGYFAKTSIPPSQLLELQHNLIKSHASGHGPALTISETRLAMALRLNVLLKGYTGVRYVLCEALLNLIQAEIYPLIPLYGSVGASGDLAPLAHLALPLIGEGWVHFQGSIISASEALAKAGLQPFQLAEKEGLGLVNGTQIMLSLGCLALKEAKDLLKLTEKITALSYEGMHANTDALHPALHASRGNPQQIFAAAVLLNELEGSYLFKTTPLRLQDSYSLRCAPQIHGPVYETLERATLVFEQELNAATDNPLVFPEIPCLISGGNFHGQNLAMQLDYLGIAFAMLSNVSERRLEQLLNPHHSQLPAFLTPHEGICSGYMASQYLSAALVNENRGLATPASLDSIPGNVGIEDHVSMGMTAAIKLKKILENTRTVLAIELLAAAQAVDLRKCAPLGIGTQPLYDRLRKYVPFLDHDRIIAEDINASTALLKELMHGL